MNRKATVIFLAGGVGSRMTAPVPKQFLPLARKPLFSYSLDVFVASDAIDAIVVVCAEEFRHHFDGYNGLCFALPGPRRQDSVYNGLQEVPDDTSLVVVHDAARPFISDAMVSDTLTAAEEHGAATVGVPVVYTVKRADDEGFVAETLPREQVWEIQTPQVVRHDVIKKGFEKALADDVTVTDDVALAELIGLPVKLVEGSRKNVKITTQEDLSFAESLLAQRGW